MIPYGKQYISDNDVKEVVNVLRSDFITQGPIVPKFEKKLCDYTGAKYAVAVNSATSALHIACLSLGLKKGDILWTSPITFVASANCAIYCGASVDFVDIDPITALISVEKLKEKLIQAEKDGKLPKIIIPVHYSGQSCNMKEFYALSCKYGFKIIEDASHAIGAKYKNEPVGNCKYSDITVFSFHPVKIITTGEGGSAMTNNLDIAEMMKLLRSHGVTRDHRIIKQEEKHPWYYEQVELGFNYRMTDLQAALGVSQLQNLDKFVAKRHTLRDRYDSLLAGLPIIKPFQEKENYSSFHLYAIQINSSKTNKRRLDIFNKLIESGIGVNVHYIPVHMQPYYKKFGFKNGDFVNSENYYKNTISLPIFFNMSYEEHDKVTDSLKFILQGS